MISKKILFGAGALVAAIAPVATAISCGAKGGNESFTEAPKTLENQ